MEFISFLPNEQICHNGFFAFAKSYVSFILSCYSFLFTFDGLARISNYVRIDLLCEFLMKNPSRKLINYLDKSNLVEIYMNLVCQFITCVENRRAIVV